MIGRADVHEQGVVALGLARRGPPRPGIEAAARDAEHATEAPQRGTRPVGGDEVELHFWSSAKYAKAFFKMSRSSVTVRSCCCSRRSCSAWAARRPEPGNASGRRARGRAGSSSAEASCGRCRDHGRPRSRLRPPRTSATASFLNCGVNVRRTRLDLLGHGTLLLSHHSDCSWSVHFSG